MIRVFVRALVRRDVQDCRVDVLRRLADQATPPPPPPPSPPSYLLDKPRPSPRTNRDRLADQASVEQRVGQCFLRQVRVRRGDSGEGSSNSFKGISRNSLLLDLCFRDCRP